MDSTLFSLPAKSAGSSLLSAFLNLLFLLVTHVMLCMHFIARSRQVFLSHEGGVGVFGCDDYRQPLRWFRVPRKNNQGICIQGLGSSAAKEKTGNQDENVTRVTGSSANGLFTSPSIVQVHDFSNVTEGSSVDAKSGLGSRLHQQVGTWMSSMFVASLDMHQRMCVAGLLPNQPASIAYLAIIF